MRLTLLLLLTLTACSPHWTIDPVPIEQAVSHRLRLYPRQTTYRILIVPDHAGVVAEHVRIYRPSDPSPRVLFPV